MSNDINGQQRTITATQVLQQHIATHDHTHTPHTNKTYTLKKIMAGLSGLLAASSLFCSSD